jgi:TonB family protein
MKINFEKWIFVAAVIFLYSSISNIIFAQNGVVTTNFPDGNISSEISYANDVLDGSAVSYYPNGNLMTKKNYSNGILEGWVKEYYPAGLIKEEYPVSFGVKDGNYKSYYENGGLKEIIVYVKGVAEKKTAFDYDPDFKASPEAFLEGNKQQEIVHASGKEIKCDAEICPVPVGGMKAIQDALIYPEHALRYGLEGIVTISATISADGSVLKTLVLKGLGLGCDEAAQDAVKKVKFLPGRTAGKAVESVLTIDVNFKIPGK